MSSRRRRGLVRLAVLGLVVALLVAVGLGEVARSSRRTTERTGDAARRVAASANTATPHPGAAATAAPTPVVPVLPADSPARSTLQRHIQAILAADGVAGDATGVCIYDLSTARLVFARHADTALRPASNEKLVTTATALARWGPTHRFTTGLFATGRLDAAGVYHGLIYLKGYGDPSLSTRAYQMHVLHLRTASLEAFVAALKRDGIRRIAGHLVGDDSYFDARRTVSTWRSEEIEDCGPLSALSLDEDDEPDGQRATDPPLFAVAQLTALLRRSGIAVTHAPTTGVTPATARLLFSARSAPLAALLAAMDKRSDNFFAETLTKGLGAAFGGAGSTAAGTRVERDALAMSGSDAAGVAVRDGSGLSYADRETAANLTRLLAAAATGDDWPVFRRSLAVAGVDGTLVKRMRHTAAQGDLQAKTGTLDLASSLSGYVTAANGHLLVFSMLMNGASFDVLAAQQAQDAIGVALARSRPAGVAVWTAARPAH